MMATEVTLNRCERKEGKKASLEEFLKRDPKKGNRKNRGKNSLKNSGGVKNVKY